MADTKLSALTELAAAPAVDDELYIRDISEAAADESKRIVISNLFTSPTLVTPALGTPASGVMTNVTGTAAGLTAGNVTTNANLTGVVTSEGNATAIADKALAIAKLADGTDGELITWSAAGVIATVAVGTATHVLTSNGVGVAPTFQAAAGGGGFTKSVYATAFEATGRHAQGFNAGGANTFGTDALALDTSTTQASSAYARFQFMYLTPEDTTWWENSLEVMFALGITFQGTNFQLYAGLGTPGITGTLITYIDRTIGFSATRAASAAFVVYATNADGTTQTATDVTAGITLANKAVNYHAVKDGTTNIKFYTDGSLRATHTTNLPTGTSGSGAGQVCVCNSNVATRTMLKISTMAVYVPYA